jgi:hypothetical protein
MVQRFASALIALVVLAGGVASAATQEWDITVPVNVKAYPAAGPGMANLGVTVYCAVGPSTMGFKTNPGDPKGGDATPNSAEGSAHATLGNANGTAGNVSVVVSEQLSTGPGSASGIGSPKSTSIAYLCWGVLDPRGSVNSTPFNFVQGKLPAIK